LITGIPPLTFFKTINAALILANIAASDTSIEFTVHTCYKMNDYWRTSEDRLVHGSMAAPKGMLLTNTGWKRERARGRWKRTSVDIAIHTACLTQYIISQNLHLLPPSWIKMFSSELCSAVHPTCIVSMIVMEQTLHPYKTGNMITLCPHSMTVKVIILYISIFRCWMGYLNVKNSDLNGYDRSLSNSYSAWSQ